MLRKISMIAIATTITLTTGCATVQAPVGGQFFSSVKGPVTATSLSDANKTGQSCASSILGLIALGDASITTAKANGGITTISAVDHQSTNILGIYGQYCTIVTGN